MSDKQFSRIKANMGCAVLVAPELYHYARGVVPPIAAEKFGLPMWAMGEAERYVNDEPVYYWFMQHSGNSYAAYGTEGVAYAAFCTIRQSGATTNELRQALQNVRDYIDMLDRSHLVTPDYVDEIDDLARAAIPEYVPDGDAYAQSKVQKAGA